MIASAETPRNYSDPDLLPPQLLPGVTQGFRADSSIPEADPVTFLGPWNSCG